LGGNDEKNYLTADLLNIDLGLNVRLMDVKAEIEQKDLDLKESESYFLPLNSKAGGSVGVPIIM